MRKLKLQMNISLDNKWSSEMSKFSIENLKKVDCLLHGRKTAIEFIPYWSEIAGNPKDKEYELGSSIAAISNLVFSNTLKSIEWDNTTIINGEIAETITALKNKGGKDILVYGGESFVSSLLKHNLVDECYLLVNPAALGGAIEAFNPLHYTANLKLVECKPFDVGTIMLHYEK